MVAIGEFGLLLVLPLYLINILGLGTLAAGFVLAAMAVGAFFSGASARHLAARMGPPRVVILGLALETAGLLALGLFISSSASVWLIAALLVVYGLGLGLASAQLTGTVLADIPSSVSGQGAATQSTVRQFGAALGSALMGSVLAHFSLSRATELLGNVPGLPAQQVGVLAGQLKESAGGTVPALAQLGTHGPLGAAGPAAVDALSSGFAQAVSMSVLAAAAFLLAGLVGSLFVASAARKRRHCTRVVRPGRGRPAKAVRSAAVALAGPGSRRPRTPARQLPARQKQVETLRHGAGMAGHIPRPGG
jgi:Na+/melibiose symporter-like transporter